MSNSNQHIKKFHDEYVSLSNDERETMRKRRNSNRDRVTAGLEKKEKPAPLDFITQGSYAMHTMVQDDDNDYDIDDGVIFDKEELKGAMGAYITSLNARNMVREAVDDGSFKKPPEVKNNCVRVHYHDGSHVDIPVYRQLEDGTVELASTDWKGSSPSDVTEWYNSTVVNKSPDTVNGRQLRRVTKLLKIFTKSRESWKSSMISGFCLSVLVDECFVSDSYSDAESLRLTMEGINNRLALNKVVVHPTRNENLTKTHSDADIRFFKDKLNDAVNALKPLAEGGCSDVETLKAWNKVFKHEYFREEIEKAQDEEKKKDKASIANALSKGNQSVTLSKGLSGITAGAAGLAAKTGNAYGGKKIE